MEFLGSLGIDINLLIAQIINFGLLLWLLTKFLYKPIIQRIEKDEKELEQTRTQKKELEQEKDIFSEQKEKETSKLKKRTHKIITEAKSIAEKIENDAHKKTDKEVLAIIKQSKSKLESLKPDIENEIFNKVRAGIGDSFKETFSNVLSTSLQKEFQNIFWADFLEQFEKLAVKKIKEPKFVKILKKTKLVAKEEGEKKNALEKELEEISFKKIGPVVLEYVYPLTDKQKKQFKDIISNKIKIKLKIIQKQNENLINGFRIEIAGTIVESNLLSIINTTDFKSNNGI